jgi:RimJ/RimL family protein N-acetyltransferase
MELDDWPVAEAIASSRLELEPLRVEHAPEMEAVLDDPALYAYTGGRPPSEAELEARYGRQVDGISPDGREGWLNWVLRLRSEGSAIGTVQATVRGRRTDRRAELAWVLSIRFQGAGYATEATGAVMTWLRARGVHSFDAHIHPAHHASAAVAERLGFTPMGTHPDGEVRWSTPAT